MGRLDGTHISCSVISLLMNLSIAAGALSASGAPARTMVTPVESPGGSNFNRIPTNLDRALSVGSLLRGVHR